MLSKVAGCWREAQAKSNPWFDPRPSFFNGKELLCVALLLKSSEFATPEELNKWAAGVLDATEDAEGCPKVSKGAFGEYLQPLRHHVFDKRSFSLEVREQVAKAMQVRAAVVYRVRVYGVQGL